MIYRSKPSLIEAVQWTGRNDNEMVSAFAGKVRIVDSAGGGGLMLAAGKDSAQGWVPVPVGHWIVCNPGDHSDLWPVDPDYFAAKYEPAREFGDKK